VATQADRPLRPALRSASPFASMLPGYAPDRRRQAWFLLLRRNTRTSQYPRRLMNRGPTGATVIFANEKCWYNSRAHQRRPVSKWSNSPVAPLSWLLEFVRVTPAPLLQLSEIDNAARGDAEGAPVLNRMEQSSDEGQVTGQIPLSATFGGGQRAIWEAAVQRTATPLRLVVHPAV